MYPASGEGSNIPPIKTLPSLEKYNPPEKSGSGRAKKTAKWYALFPCFNLIFHQITKLLMIKTMLVAF